ncbi:fungal specific transcription factor, partial [Colletotrichum plurivorum]
RSSGERKRVDLALVFALLQVARPRSAHRAHYVLVDEVFDNLDKAVQAAVVRWCGVMSHTVVGWIVLYSSDCTHKAISRQKKKKRSKLLAPAHGSQEQQQQQPHHQQQHAAQVDEESRDEQGSKPPNPSKRPLSPTPSIASQSRRRMPLPPQDVVRHVIDVYLSSFNAILPLFHPPSLYRTVDVWYRQPADAKQPSCWAAINVALALAQCHGCGRLSPAVAQAVDVAECLQNAQSVLTDVLAGDPDLQTVQILLGLGMLFMGAKLGDARPPIIFVSTAVRLAQAMGMHRRDSYEGLTPNEAVQRRRVFWIAYILDRDVVARTRQAPIQHDADLDLDLPPNEDELTVKAGLGDADVDFNAGFVHVAGNDTCGEGAMTRFNLFRARIELAQIQERVYDCAFSVRARYMDAGESARLAQGIKLSIRQWKARLPAALGVDALLSQADNESGDDKNNTGSSSAPNLPTVMCYMHSLITECLGQLCRVNSMEVQWIEKVLSYARGTSLGDGEMTTMITPSFASSVPSPPAPPQGWSGLVSECRDFMRLFQSIRKKTPEFVNVQLCPFTSALICLSVNSFLSFEGDNRLADERLMAESAVILGRYNEQTQCAAIAKVLEMHTELDWHLMFLTAGLVV